MGKNCALDQADLEMLCCEISDEALEIAAAPGHEEAIGNITLFCTALYLCPGP